MGQGLAGGEGGGDSRRCRVLALMIELSSALGEGVREATRGRLGEVRWYLPWTRDWGVLGVSKASPGVLDAFCRVARPGPGEEPDTQDEIGNSGVPEEGGGVQEGGSGPQCPGQSTWKPPGLAEPI